MSFVTSLIVAASLMSAASLSVQDRPDFSGVWRLDAAKTVTTGGPLQLEGPGVRTQSLPKRLKGSNPSYPSGAMASPLAAVVIVQTVITAQGDVASLTFVNSVPAFNRAVAEGVSKWKYEPTLVDGMPVPVRMNVTATFNMPRRHDPAEPELALRHTRHASRRRDPDLQPRWPAEQGPNAGTH